MTKIITAKTWLTLYGIIFALFFILLLTLYNTGLLSNHIVAGGHSLVYKANPALQVLIGLLLIIVLARILHLFLSKLHQPRVISEMIAGILIGPSFFGLFWPHWYNTLFSQTTISNFGIIAQISIIIYMFIIGVKFDSHELNENNQTVIATAKASIIFPFLLGLFTAAWLYSHPDLINLNTNEMSFFVFALFIGVSMSITAFPVLARIITDRNLQNTTLGTFAMTCASFNDVTAWCLLAIVIGISKADVSSCIITIVLTVVFISGMLLIVKPLAAKISDYVTNNNYTDEQQIAIILVTLLISAILAEYIGIHAIFGAFILGVITPRDNKVINDLISKLHDVICILFLPTFFAYIGIKTQLALIDSLSSLVLCLVIIIVAVLGKLGGTYYTARLFGTNKNLALKLGFLMNTRGLVELIVLNIGLEAGIISYQLFAILIVMALVTTCTTGPALHYLRTRS